MILSDFIKAVLQLSDPRFRRVLWIGIALSIALLFGFYAVLLWLIDVLDPGSLEIPGVGQVTWLGDLLGWGSLFLMLFLSMFLMIPVASAITSLFLDDVAQSVEDAHYPDLPVPPRISWGDAVRDTVNFLGVLIGANLLAIILYLMFPFLAVFIFYGMNGFLLGQEYFQIAAMRREGRQGAREMRRRHRLTIWIAGCVMAVPLSIPLVNLLIPVLGAAMFTHLYHRLSAKVTPG